MALINCPECNKEISDKAEFCPHCGFKLPDQDPTFQGVYCPKCLESRIRTEKNDLCSFCKLPVKNSIVGTVMECYNYTESHPELKESPEFSQEAYYKRINYVPGEYITTNSPKCPTCGSTSISKISTLSRAASVGFWGLASSKIGKTQKCNKCGYSW